MIAPECDICGSWADGEYIQFKVIDPKQIEFNERCQKEPLILGHPYGNRYFCNEHLLIAQKYCHLPYYEEAYKLIKKEVQG